MKWLRAMFLCMVVFAALTVVANDSFSQKEVRVCASTSLFSIANKEPAAFISFQEIITPLTSFPAFGEKLLFPYCLIDFFPRFVYPVGSFVVLRTEGKLCSIKIRLLARTILLLCALSYCWIRHDLLPVFKGIGENCVNLLYNRKNKRT